jgi:hypothetical protein
VHSEGIGRAAALIGGGMTTSSEAFKAFVSRANDISFDIKY